MAGRELLRRAQIEHDDAAGPRSLDELGTGDRFELVASAEVLRRDAVDLSKPSLGKGPERREQIEDARFGKPVEDSQTLSSRQNQSGVTQDLQMAGGIGDRQRRTGPASTSTDRSPCARTSRSSSRAGLESAPPTRENCSYSRSFSSLSFIGRLYVINGMVE